MAEYGKVENPTLDAQAFKMGDFIQWLLHDRIPSFAVVTKVNRDDITIRHFEDGFPYEYPLTPKYGGVGKATKEASLVHFRQISRNLEKEFEAGGLAGAVSARRQDYLNGIINQLLTSNHDAYYAAIIEPVAPMTGRYVLMGIYSGQGESEHLESLIVAPRLSERTVSKVMKGLNPEGFGRIPSDVYNTPATSHGSLVAYQTFEVPEKALYLLGNSKTLELKIK